MKTAKRLDLRIAMLRTDLRVVDIARELGVTPPAVTMVLNGDRHSRRILDGIRACIERRKAERRRAA